MELIMNIDFSKFEDFSKLFLNYINNFDEVKEYYHKNFREAEDLFATMQEIMNSNYHNREKLVEILNKQYKDYPASTITKKNIELLKEKTTFAIVTGQQAGIIGGPLYNIYKIITTIKLCNILNHKFDEYRFVPVFWMEVEDHDFDEIRNVYLLDKDYELKQITYDDVEKFTNRGSVGKLKINKNIETFLTQLDNILPFSSFKSNLIEKLRKIYCNNKTFSQAFKELLFEFFDRYGLIIFDTIEKDVKEYLKPIFIDEINNYIEHSVKLVSISADLEKNYHAQIKIRPVNLFFSNDNSRYLIEPSERNGEFIIKSINKVITSDELIEMINNEPYNFSPNVVLRPICQDYIFPTVFYVGGPSEIAYFAQIFSIYDNFNIVKPIIYPRASATIVEKSNEKRLEKLGIELIDIFIDYNDFINKINSQNVDNNLIEAVDELFNNFSLDFERLKNDTKDFDQNLINNFNKTYENIAHSINILKKKINEAQLRKNSILIEQAKRLHNSLYPEATLQERYISWIYFVSKYGPTFIDEIYDKLQINAYDHQIINYTPKVLV